LVARAAGKPHCWPMGARARSGVGAPPTPSLAFWPSPAERLPETDMQPGGPCNCNGDSESMTWDFADGCSIRHMHRWLRSHSQRRDAYEDWSNQRIAFTRHGASHPISLATYLQTPEESEHTGRKKPSAHRLTLRVGTCAVTTGSAWVPHMCRV
jgi:hypothetical protein